MYHGSMCFKSIGCPTFSKISHIRIEYSLLELYNNNIIIYIYIYNIMFEM